MADAVLVEQRDHILIVTINRPAARNAIDAAVTSGIAAAMDELDGRKDLSIGILTGAGGTFSPAWTSRRSCAARAWSCPAEGSPG